METETKHNVYGNESSPKITYKYVDGYWQKQYKIYDYLGSLRYTISQMNKVLNYKGYDPYGNELIDTIKQTRQGYIGKENDVENGLGDHGVRKYEPSIGRFNSGEPLSDKFPGISPYVYCFNNPIRLIDWNGFGPGDPFKTTDAAAIDFAMTYNVASINNCKEFATTLYSYVAKDGKTYISYITPLPGKNDESFVGSAPEGTKMEAIAHTHGCYESDYGTWNDIYSDSDFNLGDHKGVPLYLVTPSGTLKKYDPETKDISMVKMKEKIPSDPNDPYRYNKKDPKFPNKNEQPEMLPDKQLPSQK